MNKQKIKKIHRILAVKKKYPDVFFDLVWTHSLIVADISNIIVASLDPSIQKKINPDLLIQGSLIHDIGVYLCFDKDFNPDPFAPPYFYHGWVGEKYLIDQGITDPHLLRFTTCHIGVGITQKDILREHLKLPQKDFIPQTLEEKIVTYADKFHTKSPSFVSFDIAKAILEKIDIGKGTKMDQFKAQFGLPELKPLKAKYLNWHQKITNRHRVYTEASKCPRALIQFLKMGLPVRSCPSVAQAKEEA